MKKMKSVVSSTFLILGVVICSQGALITFDNFPDGTSCEFDGDGDGLTDVLFSTMDPIGFHNLIDPFLDMTYVSESGLEGFTSFSNQDDLRVDFLAGAKGTLTFGFALFDFEATPETWADFKVFDNSGLILAKHVGFGEFTITPEGESFFPEGEISVSFDGTASYAVFDFNNSPGGCGRYIIDNFRGTFGSSEVPEPGILTLFGCGFLSMVGFSRVRKRKSYSN